MPLSVQVHETEWGRMAAVRDSQHPALEATFSYRDDPDGWVLAGVDVHLLDVTGKRRGLQASSLRDLPIVRWQRAARAELFQALMRQFRGYWNDQGVAIRTLGVGKTKYGDLRRNPALMRRLKGVQRLALVARLYRESLASGRPDPAAAVANELHENRSTIRSLIHRARKAGLLEPVASA